MFGIDRRAARVAWTVFLVAGGLYVIFLLRKTLFIFALALFISHLMMPLVDLLERYRRSRASRAASVAVAFAMVIVAIVVGVALIGPTISEQGSQLIERLPVLVANADAVTHITLPTALEPWRERMSGMLKQVLAGATGSAVPFASGVVQGIMGAASNLIFLVIIPILAFLFLKDGHRAGEFLLSSMIPDKRRRVVAVMAAVQQVLGKYVRSLGLLSLATFVAYAGFFVATGVPFGVLLGVLAALLEFIPLIGPLAAVGLALLVALVAGYEHLLWMAGFFAFYRTFQDYVLAPRLMGSGVGLHPAVVIFGFLAGEQLAGVPGMFLAIPILAALRIVVARSSSLDEVPAVERRAAEPTRSD